jgi:hypothetical protein
VDTPLVDHRRSGDRVLSIVRSELMTLETALSVLDDVDYDGPRLSRASMVGEVDTVLRRIEVKLGSSITSNQQIAVAVLRRLKVRLVRRNSGVQAVRPGIPTLATAQG